MKIVIDTDELKKLAQDAGKIVLAPEGEAVLLALDEFEELLEQVRTEAKKTLEEAALALDPSFKSITSDHYKVMYKDYGSKYLVDAANVEQLPDELAETEFTVRIPGFKTVQWINNALSPLKMQIAKKVTKKDEPEEWVIKNKIDTKATDKFIKENKGIPVGVILPDSRPKSLSWTKRKEVEQHG